MDQFFYLVALFGCLAAGMALHRARLSPPIRVTDALARWTLYALLASMGLRLGQSKGLAERLPTIGALAMATAVATVVGTVAAQWAAAPLFRHFEACALRAVSADSAAAAATASRGAADSLAAPPASATGVRFDFFAHLRAPLRLLAIVAAAFVIGFILPESVFLSSGEATTWILYALLVLIGIQTAENRVDFRAMLFSPAVLLAPALTVIGSLAGSALVGRFFSLSLGRSLALGAGFGWYSLSGVLITDLGDPALGSAAFLANMLRETVALLAIPFLASGGRAEAAVGAGGATSMDVTLPLIERCAGPASVPLALSHGLLLTLLVPVLVPLLFRLG